MSTEPTPGTSRDSNPCPVEPQPGPSRDSNPAPSTTTETTPLLQERTVINTPAAHVAPSGPRSLYPMYYQKPVTFVPCVPNDMLIQVEEEAAAVIEDPICECDPDKLRALESPVSRVTKWASRMQCFFTVALSTCLIVLIIVQLVKK